MKLKLVIGLMLILMVFLISCKPVALDDRTTTVTNPESSEDVDITDDLNELDELDSLNEELDDISFEELEEINLE
jgi:hypothetical protein